MPPPPQDHLPPLPRPPVVARPNPPCQPNITSVRLSSWFHPSIHSIGVTVQILGSPYVGGEGPQCQPSQRDPT